jgi:hypothetical protein
LSHFFGRGLNKHNAEFECLSSNFYLFREIASQGLVHALDVDDRG